jgi:WYL domain
VLGAETLEETFERPPGLESLDAALRAVAQSHPPCEVEVLLEKGMERAREMVPPMLPWLEERDGGVVLRSTTSDLGGMARVLSGLFCPFLVLKPPELQGPYFGMPERSLPSRNGWTAYRRLRTGEAHLVKGYTPLMHRALAPSGLHRTYARGSPRT